MIYRPTQKTARLAPYLMAIKEAHEAGWTWLDLLNVVESEGLEIADKPVNLRHTYERAMRRYRKGTLKARQLPLPGVTSDTSNENEANQEEPGEALAEPQSTQAQVEQQAEAAGDQNQDHQPEQSNDAAQEQPGTETNQEQAQSAGDRKESPGESGTQSETGNSNRRLSVEEERRRAGITFDDDKDQN